MEKHTTATSAIAYAFLQGEVLTIKTAFKLFGVSNLPREVGRSIERKFDVRVSKVRRQGKSRYGISCCWYEYRLNKSEHNLPGIKLMEEYIKLHTK